jgi:hypothetical protein
LRPVNHGGLGSRYAGQLRKSAAGPPDRSNRSGPRGPDLGRGGPDPADFAGAADPRQEALEQAIIEKAVILLLHTRSALELQKALVVSGISADDSWHVNGLDRCSSHPCLVRAYEHSRRTSDG